MRQLRREGVDVTYTLYTYNCCHYVPNVGPESPGWWPSPTSSVSPSSSSCPAAWPLYFHSSPWNDLSRRLFIFHTRTPPRGTPPPPRVFSFYSCSFFLPFLIFRSLFKRIPRPVLAASSRESPTFHLVLPSLTRELNSFFWYRFGMVVHCTSLVRSWSIARPVT